MKLLRLPFLWLLTMVGVPVFAAPTAEDYKHGVGPCMRARDFDCAEKNWVQFLRLRPADSNAVANLGIVLNLQGKHEAAVAQFQKAVGLGEGTYDLFAYYARSLEVLGRIDEAIDWSYKALAVHPDLVDVRGDLARLLLAKGRPHEALSILSAYDEKQERLGRRPYFEGRRIAIESSFAARRSGTAASPAAFRASKVGGHFYVPVSAGEGRPRSFVLDTGASLTTVSEEFLSSSKAAYAVSRASVSVTLADGRQHQVRELVVANMKVGTVELKDVAVVACKTCVLLLGQSTLAKFDMNTSKVNGIEFMTLMPRPGSSIPFNARAVASLKGTDGPEAPSPQLVRARECLSLDESLRSERQRLNAVVKANNEGFSRIQQEGRALADLRRSLIDADQATIDAYNERVNAHNRAIEAANRSADQVNDEQDTFNAAVSARNEKCSQVPLNQLDLATFSKERQARRRAAGDESAAPGSPRH